MSNKPAITCSPVVALACALSCAANPANKPPDREEIIHRASQRFERAVLFKPRDSGLSIEFTFAPLIVEEIEQTAAQQATTQAASVARSDARTVYYSSRMAQLGAEKLDQIEYVWILNAASPDESAPCAKYRGLRITLDHDGYPLVWEALTSEAGPHLVFVAENLEAEAKALFGEPEGESRFAVESVADSGANAIIVATIEQGPVPMGPYVYLSKPPERAIINVLCRCSPSPVDDFAATPMYDLQPIEVLEKQCPEIMKQLRATPPPNAILRWPRSP